jgi:alkanesulfonate monooxygenase SsuD/methylene tetrahydromethanopterin reductase-like flavin-dependent oxidoreductase (luciferase family)
MVAPYHTPWQLIEEIGMLDHLTGGRLEIGTAAGIPNEMAKVGLGPDEARERNDEILDVLDAALKSPVISHHGKFWQFDNLRLTPAAGSAALPARLGDGDQRFIRPQGGAAAAPSSARVPSPWRRSSRSSTPFATRPTRPAGRWGRTISAFAGRSRCFGDDREARGDGRSPAPQHAQVSSKPTRASTRPTGRRSSTRRRRMRSPLATTNSSPAPPESVTAQIIDQCRAAGAGHFAATFNRSQPPETLKQWYADYGRRGHSQAAARGGVLAGDAHALSPPDRRVLVDAA